jgi:hypothetical protein
MTLPISDCRLPIGPMNLGGTHPIVLLKGLRLSMEVANWQLAIDNRQ